MSRNLNVLHIMSHFYTTSVYENILTATTACNVNSTIFSPVYDRNNNRYNDVHHAPSLYFKYHKLFYKLKLRKAVTYLRKHFSETQFDHLHAHTLFSDGALAYEVNKLGFNLNYTVTVRDTDLNVFLKYKPYLKPYGKKVLEGADNIICLNVPYKQQVQKIFDISSKRISVVPNILPDFWGNGEVRTKGGSGRFIFVGKNIPRKNLDAVVRSFLVLKKKYPHVVLSLVGDESFSKLAQIDDAITSYGKVDKKTLKSLYQQSDCLVLPSLTETFGMVYLEALSQGLSIIHSKNQGVDGYFNDSSQCIAVEPKSDTEIISAMETLMQLVPSEINLSDFSSQSVAEQLTSLYK